MYQQKYKLGLLFTTTFIIIYYLKFPVVDAPHQEETISQQGRKGGTDDKTGEERAHTLLAIVRFLLL